MDAKNPTLIQCDLLLISGRIQSLRAERDWQLWEFRKYIEKTLEIPEFEQQFACAAAKVKSESVMKDLLMLQGSERLTLNFSRSSTPACFDELTAREIWEAFLLFSPDKGDGMDSAHVPDVMRFMGMFKSSRKMAQQQGASSRSLTFPEVLQVLAEWKEAVEARPEPAQDLERELTLVDVEGTGYIPMRDFRATVQRVYEANREDESSDEEDDASDASSDVSSDGTSSNGDELIDWRENLRAMLEDAEDDFLW
eukprot:TRINITY_DN3902_c0_g1_i2.p1 TRINITY_DN3902_c0_g1~~TRINITY_DN3902_c0_g1_i2.p1  ORF type:complete len:271 (-),score=72.82 TRINITY_DN3902_c0_g1_i2:865-1623(-)